MMNDTQNALHFRDGRAGNFSKPGSAEAEAIEKLVELLGTLSEAQTIAQEDK